MPWDQADPASHLSVCYPNLEERGKIGVHQALNFSFFPLRIFPPCNVILSETFLKNDHYFQNSFQLDQAKKHLQSHFQSGGTSYSGNLVSGLSSFEMQRYFRSITKASKSTSKYLI